jgi:hypothetical protein
MRTLRVEDLESKVAAAVRMEARDEVSSSRSSTRPGERKEKQAD